MKFKPLDNRVLVEPIDESKEQTSRGGIIIPATHAGKNAPGKGTVKAVGNDEELAKLLKVGDLVLYPKAPVIEIEFDGVKHILLNRENILGVVEQ